MIPPGPVNTSVNGVANFTCTAIANAFRWEANGVQIDSNERIAINMAPVNAEQRRSTLDMTISSTDNATNITCTAISLNRQNESTAGRSVTSDVSVPVLLLVQGMGIATAFKKLREAVQNSLCTCFTHMHAPSYSTC